MKRISIGFFVLFLASLLFSACQENIYIDWKLANEKWMTNFVAAHKSDSNFYTTASGLSYHLYYAGYPKERQPNPGSDILVTYKGTLINDSVFDQATVPAAFTLSKTIPAWREIMPKLHNGAHLKIYAPTALAYDTATTYLPRIPPYSALIFDITLLESQY